MEYNTRNTPDSPIAEYLFDSVSPTPTFIKDKVSVVRPESGVYEFDEEAPPTNVGSRSSTVLVQNFTVVQDTNENEKSTFAKTMMWIMIAIAIGCFITVGVLLYINNDSSTNPGK